MYRGLLFALYAMRNELLSHDQFLTGFQAWLADRSKTLDDILVDQSVLNDRQQRVLWQLVDLVLEKQDLDETQTLACLSWASPIRDELLPLASDDPEVSQLVATIGRCDLQIAVGSSTGSTSKEDPCATWNPDLGADPYDTVDESDPKSRPVGRAATDNPSSEKVIPKHSAAVEQDSHVKLLGLEPDAMNL